VSDAAGKARGIRRVGRAAVVRGGRRAAEDEGEELEDEPAVALEDYADTIARLGTLDRPSPRKQPRASSSSNNPRMRYWTGTKTRDLRRDEDQDLYRVGCDPVGRVSSSRQISGVHFDRPR